MSDFGQFSFSVLKNPHSAYAYTLQILQNHRFQQKKGLKKGRKTRSRELTGTTLKCAHLKYTVCWLVMFVRVVVVSEYCIDFAVI